MSDIVAKLRERLTAHIDTQREQIDKLIRENVALTARVEELEGALKAELADHEEAISHDRSGLEYASLVGIPLSNADSLAQSVLYHERRAKFIRAAITKGESHD